MKDHRSKARKQLARCVDAIDEEYIEFLAPLLIRIVVVVQRFFAAPRHAAVDVPTRNRSQQATLGMRTLRAAGGLQSSGTGRSATDAATFAKRTQ